MKKIIFLVIAFLAFQFSSAQVPDSFPDGIILGSFASDPTGFRAGQLYYNTTNDVVKFYDGIVWSSIPNDIGYFNPSLEGIEVEVIESVNYVPFSGDKITIGYDGATNLITDIWIGWNIGDELQGYAGLGEGMAMRLTNTTNHRAVSFKFDYHESGSYNNGTGLGFYYRLEVTEGQAYQNALAFSLGNRARMDFYFTGERTQTLPSVLSAVDWANPIPSTNMGDRFLVLNSSGAEHSSWQTITAGTKNHIFEVVGSASGAGYWAIQDAGSYELGQRVYSQADAAFYIFKDTGAQNEWVLETVSGDNLGNHTMTQVLNTDGFGIDTGDGAGGTKSLSILSDNGVNLNTDHYGDGIGNGLSINSNADNLFGITKNSVNTIFSTFGSNYNNAVTLDLRSNANTGAQIRMFNPQNFGTGYWNLYSGEDFGIYNNTLPALSIDFTTSGVTLPNTTTADIVTLGAKAVLTKEYGDANYLGGGSGDVSKVGTPLDNQLGVWTGDGTIEGTSGLTYSGTLFQASGDIYTNNGNQVISNGFGFRLDTANTGFFPTTASGIGFKVGGFDVASISATGDFQLDGYNTSKAPAISGTNRDLVTDLSGNVIHKKGLDVNPIGDKKWVLFGDSVTNSLTTDFPADVIQELGLTGTVSNSVDNNTIFDQATVLDGLIAGNANYFADFDIFSMLVGINDYAVDSVLGTKNDAVNSATYAGKLKHFIEVALTSNPEIQIYLMTMFNVNSVSAPYKTDNTATIPWQVADLNNLIKQIASDYSIKVIDLENQAQFNLETIPTYTADLLHPDAEGNKIIGKIVSSAFKSNTAVSYGGQVSSVVAGTGIDVDSTDPANPIVTAERDFRFTATVGGAFNLDWTGTRGVWVIVANAALTLSDTNLPQGVDTKVIELIVSGDFALTLPATWTALPYNDPYDGTGENHIVVTCVNGNSGSEQIYYSLTNI